jgi:tetratricopeptide (TPR) repeat protein
VDLDLKRNPTLAGTVKAEQAVFRCLVDLGQGRVESARARLSELNSQLPHVDSANRTSMTFYFDLLSAEVALAEGKVDEAVGLAEKIVFLSFPTMNIPDQVNYNIPFLKDVLARAYWKKRELDKAAAEYEKLMTIDPKNQVRYLIPPLYHYRLGRVLEEKGEKDKARLQYQKFLDCWKSADARHPEQADARQRLAKLKSR